MTAEEEEEDEEEEEEEEEEEVLVEQDSMATLVWNLNGIQVLKSAKFECVVECVDRKPFFISGC